MFKAHIKLIALEELKRRRLSGYDLMRILGEVGKKPSPGYIYPLLNTLEEKGFISMKEEGRKKIYFITKEGKSFLKSLKEKRDAMLEKVIEMWKPIAEKKEIDDLKKFKINRKKDNLPIRDKEIIAKLHSLIFSFYRNKKVEKAKQMKKILEGTIKKLEKINDKKRKN